MPLPEITKDVVADTRKRTVYTVNQSNVWYLHNCAGNEQFSLRVLCVFSYAAMRVALSFDLLLVAGRHFSPMSIVSASCIDSLHTFWFSETLPQGRNSGSVNGVF